MRLFTVTWKIALEAYYANSNSFVDSADIAVAIKVRTLPLSAQPPSLGGG
jgi:hypothetical protein